MNELSNALYLKDKAKAKKFVVFPLLPDGSDIWYVACGADEKIFSKREGTAFNEKDFDEFFFRLFPREFVRCFLKIKVQELYSKGKSQSPEIKEGRNTYRLYVSYDRRSSYLELNYATNIPVKVSGSEYDPGESNLIYLFRVTEKGHIELVKVLIAG